MSSELRTFAALTVAAVLVLAGAARDATSANANCGDPVEGGQAACPDLELENSKSSPVEQDGELVIRVLVKNTGNEESPVTRVVASSPGWDDAAIFVRKLDPPDDPGVSVDEVAIRLTIPDDKRGQTSTFSLLVDPDRKVDEDDEENNDLEIGAAISDGPAPDLLVSDASHQPPDGSRIAISMTVRNIGQEESPETTIDVSGAGWSEASQDVEPLGPEGDAQVVVELTIPEIAWGKTSTLSLTARPVLGEQDITNNSISLEVAVPPVEQLAPNLELSINGDRLVDGGERLELLATIRNIGSRDAPETKLTATAPQWREASASVPVVPVGDSTDAVVAFLVPESQRGQPAKFVVEVEPVPGETATGDNRRSVSVDIPAIPDRGGLGWVVPAIVAAIALVTAVGLAAWRLTRPRRPRAPPMEDADFDTIDEQESEQESETLTATPARVVNTGFASAAAPSAPLDPAIALDCGASYLFWLDVGPPVTRSAERTPVDLPWHQLPPSPELTVAVFSLSNGSEGFVLDEGADVGSLVLGTSGAVEVSRQPGPEHVPIARTRLLFPVHAPLVEVDAQLRCSIFCRGTLVQSRLVTARVRRDPVGAEGPGFESVLDFTLAPALDPISLSALPEPTLTVMLNRSANSHDFTFYGAGGFKSQSSFDVLEVQDLIRSARAGLRHAAWGDEQDWREGLRYLYLDGYDPDRLRRDLVDLAKRGFRFYASIADRLAGDEDAFELSDRLALPGSIQIASIESPRHVLPAALLYDYLGFDSTQPADAYTLCPRFVGALRSGEELDVVECFSGECESRGKATVVCPSGFWGYRHRLGMPVSVIDAPDSPVAIFYDDQGPSIVLAASTDFELLAAHTEVVTRLCPRLLTAMTREETLRLMRQVGIHIVYFYCHGGVQDRVPFLKVGGPGERGITRDLLFSQRIRWTTPRPLIFINGCQTTALEPETAIELVSGLVRGSHASGVIGTEITIFEPLARDFAEAFLARFLGGASVGEAVRFARLTLLAAGNPLGLAYIPFALENLRLIAGTPANN